MNVVFLDFDGVLNSRRFRASTSDMIDEKYMVFLDRIVKATGAKIVLSTSWRTHWDAVPEKCGEAGREIDRIFGKYDMEIIGKTPVLKDRGRAQEIQCWLDSRPDIERYVILDDSPFGWGKLSGHLVRTGGLTYGLDAEMAEAAIAILSGSGSF